MSGYFDGGGNPLDNLFAFGDAGLNTGYKVFGGGDLGNRYYPYSNGAKRANTGYKIAGGQDLSDLFQNSAVPIIFGTGTLTVADRVTGSSSFSERAGYRPTDPGGALGSYSVSTGVAPASLYCLGVYRVIPEFSYSTPRTTYLFPIGSQPYAGLTGLNVTVGGATAWMTWNSSFGYYEVSGDPFNLFGQSGAALATQIGG